MNPTHNPLTMASIPVVNRISEEPEVPFEGNITSQDLRLSASNLSGQIRHHESNNLTSAVQSSSDIPFNKVELVKKRDEKAIIKNLPPGQFQPGQIVNSEIISSEPITGQALREPVILSSVPIPAERFIPLGATVQSQGQYTEGFAQPNQFVNQTESVTRRDEKALEKNLPGGLQEAHMEQSFGGVQSSLPGQAIQGTTIRQQNIGGLQSSLPGQAITGIPIQQGGGVHTEYVKETTIVTEQRPGAQPGYVVTGMTGVPVIENISEIQQVDSQYMRDSPVLVSRVEQSRWEQQQFELSSMRHDNHQNFENWEVNRNTFVNDRLNIMNDLLAGMERTLSWFDVGVEKVILFFKERESQELQYSKTVKHGLTQLGEHFQQSEHPEVLGAFTQGMKESDAFHAKEKRNAEIMGMFIKKDVLDWILLPAEKNYKAQVAALRNPLHSHKKKMDHLAAKRERAYNKYFKLYDSVQKGGKAPKTEDSLFKKQLKYSLASREELRMLRLYDEQGMLVINEFAKLNSIRMAEVQRAFTLYLAKYQELYQNSATPPDPILNLIETSNSPDSIANLFTVRNLLSPPNYEFVQRTLGMPGDVSYPSLTPFLVEFPDSIDPTRTSFVTREWDAVKKGGLLKKPRACSVIATINNNLLIVEKKHEDREMGKVKDPMNLRYTRVEDVAGTSDGTVLKVVERTPGTIFQHTHRAKLKFETQGDAQQFMEFVNNQVSGDV